MDFSSLTARLHEWKTEFRRTLETGASGPEATGTPEWYTGLAVSPASFSQQLGDMQKSILRANADAPEAGRTSHDGMAETESQLSR